MKQDISDQKQIYVDYYTINKSANKGYHKRCTIEFHSSYDIKQKTSPRSEKKPASHKQMLAFSLNGKINLTLFLKIFLSLSDNDWRQG